MTNFIQGTVFITRSIDENLNTTPGYWNHAAIYDDGCVIEALRTTECVVRHHVNELLKHPQLSDYLVLEPIDPEKGKLAAISANKLVGVKYALLGSMFRKVRPHLFGLNCVALVRKSYRDAYLKDPLWRIPDHVIDSDWFTKWNSAL